MCPELLLDGHARTTSALVEHFNHPQVVRQLAALLVSQQALLGLVNGDGAFF